MISFLASLPTPVLAVLFILVGLSLVSLTVLAAAASARSTKHKLPKGLSSPPPPAPASHATEIAKVKDVTRDAFRERKVPSEIDFIVVGSGMGSLYASALLAKAGFKILVLEQHYVAGGCTHSFEDKGFEFDTGLHYVGRIEKYQTLFDLVTDPSAKKVRWARMGTEEDGFCYDEIKLGSDEPFKFCAGEEAFISGLVKEFPKEEAAVREWVRLCQRANKLADNYFYAKIFPSWLQSLMNRFVNQEYFEFASKTTHEVAASLTKDKRLIAILCGQFGNYGLAPENSSFLIQAGITAHYMGGGYYPIGGSQVISRALIPTINRAGGRVLVKARVTSIDIDERSGRAVGVTVAPVKASGEADLGKTCKIRARCGVISGAGTPLTHSLVPEGKFRDQLGYGPMLEKVKPSISHVYAFVGMNGTSEELGLRGSNLWVLPVAKDADANEEGKAGLEDYDFMGAALDNSDRDIDYREPAGPWEGKNEDDDRDDMLLFMGFPGRKDPSFNERFPGKATAEIITTAHPEWFEKYLVKDDERAAGAKGNPNQAGKRQSEAYKELKAKLAEKFERALARHYPKTKGKVEFISIATPLTNLYYLNRADSYGLEHTPAHYAGALDLLRPQTAIPGLYVTGQDCASVGIVGALNGGILTAHAIMGYTFWDLVVAKRNLIEDLMAMDKEAEKTKKTVEVKKEK